MYAVYGDGICIYNDESPDMSQKALSPQLQLKDNTAGSFTITLPVTNAGYDQLARLTSEIIVYRDDVEMWSGRITNEKKDFWNNSELTCEGELAYLNDTTQPPAVFNNQSVSAFLTHILSVHNQKVEPAKKFYPGIVNVSSNLYRFTNNESTLEIIFDRLVDRLGGHLRIRKENGIRYLDYLAEYPNISPQEIQFGKNLLDFTREWDMTELATVCMPRGERLETSPIEGLEAYLDVTSVNGGSRYVTNEPGIVEFGWLEAVVDWDDVTLPANLLTKAQQWLADQQFDAMIVEVTAVDLRLLGINVDSINLLDQVKCISPPHGMDRYFPITELSITLDSPENSNYVLGETVPQNTTGSSGTRTGGSLASQIAKQPLPNDLLAKARQDSAGLINMATNGVITIHKDHLLGQSDSMTISDGPWENTPLRYWIWNMGGLGYTDDGGQTYKAAITMNGTINGQLIAANTVMAESINIGYTNELQNGGLAASLIFDSLSGLNIYNGNLTIWNKPNSDPTKVAVFQFDTQTNSLNLTGRLVTTTQYAQGATYGCIIEASTNAFNGTAGAGLRITRNGVSSSYFAKGMSNQTGVSGLAGLDIFDAYTMNLAVGAIGGTTLKRATIYMYAGLENSTAEPGIMCLVPRTATQQSSFGLSPNNFTVSVGPYSGGIGTSGTIVFTALTFRVEATLNMNGNTITRAERIENNSGGGSNVHVISSQIGYVLCRAGSAGGFEVRNNYNMSWSTLNMNGNTITNQGSDERIKENIVESDICALNILNDLKLFEFDYKFGEEYTHARAGKHERLGFIAQQAKDILPEIISYDKESDRYNLQSLEIIPFLTKAIQELNQRIIQLEG